MKKKIWRILPMVIVVGMMAAIPASTQIVSEERSELSDGANLQMLILVNRLELSEEQMGALQDIFAGLLEEKQDMDGLRDEFEDAMIEFNGAGEELDELLVAFREQQVAAAEALRESIETSLDETRDLLSINQGITLREALPELMGGSALRGTDRGAGQLRNMPQMMEEHMQTMPMGRGVTGQQAQRSGQIQSPMQSGMGMSGRSGSFDSNSMSDMMREHLGDDGSLQTRGERFGQDIDSLEPDAMWEQMQDRFEQFDVRVPEEMRQQLEERFGGVVQRSGERLGQDFSGRTNQSLSRTGSVVLGQLQGRGWCFGEGSPLEQQHGQALRSGQLAERGDLFELLEQVANVLELKMEALE